MIRRLWKMLWNTSVVLLAGAVIAVGVLVVAFGAALVLAVNRAR